MAKLHLGGVVDAGTHERTGDDVELDPADLTTHGVIVGMTGSGKTGLGVVLVEEVLRAGLPALVIDPKGDLTNLGLTFPDLAAADFRPWIDEARASAAGLSPDELAAREATTWRDGLAAWGYGTEQIAALRAATDVTIYTPGSRAGVPIDVVGSLQVPATDDPEIVGDEIDGYVGGLLALVGIDADPLSSREHILLANLIQHSWSQGTGLDLPTLVGQVQRPPLRKLGVFELEQFFPSDDRMQLAMRLNGLLAAPAFAAWGAGQPLDVQALLYTPEGRGRCAVVTTAHLADDERQFVTTLVLSKLITWMRRQSGTSDLRVLVYMDEVAGYLPPTANPPTKQPIMVLMKQARAFGVGVVLATQNPVDIDYKAISNAGTWMIGRLQTERDKDRLLDGMTAAAGTVDVGAVADTIGGLAKREFVLRRAGRERPEVFTTRWAMSYLRGPMTRDQIEALRLGGAAPATGSAAPAGADDGSAAAVASAAPAPSPAVPPGPAAVPADATDAVDATDAADAGAPGAGSAAAADVTPVMPEVHGDVPVRWVDPGAPWLAAVGGAPTGTTYAAGAVARVAVRYDDTKADLVHDVEYEAVLHPLPHHVDVTAAAVVDHDDRDLRDTPPPSIAYRLVEAPIGESRFWTQLRKDLVGHVTASLSIEVARNRALRLFGRPGEPAADFAARCLRVAGDAIDAEAAALRDRYETKLAALRDRAETAADAADAAARQQEARQRGDLLTSAGSILGGLLGGRRSAGALLGQLGRAAGRTGRTSASRARVDAARGKVARLEAQLQDLEDELADDLVEIDARWRAKAAEIDTVAIGLERSDVRVTQLALAWLPTS